jgi:large conductance mechanosensitive channel
VLKEFKEFISKGNVVDLAVAVVIGAAFALIVTSFVNNLLMPIIGLIFGGKQPSFDQYSLGINGVDIRYGSFLSAVVNFVIIAFALFLVVKAFNRMQSMRKTQEEKDEEEATEVELLTEIRDLLRAGAASGTSATS